MRDKAAVSDVESAFINTISYEILLKREYYLLFTARKIGKDN